MFIKSAFKVAYMLIYQSAHCSGSWEAGSHGGGGGGGNHRILYKLLKSSAWRENINQVKGAHLI